MEKKISDEELDRLLEEQFLNEADAIEDAIFSDDFEEYEEETEEEVDAAYEELVSRLKERGEYREEDEKVVSIPDRGKCEKESPKKKIQKCKEKSCILDSRCFHRGMKIAGVAAVCLISVFAASMTSKANRQYFINSMKYLAGDDVRMIVDNVENNDRHEETEDKSLEEIETKLGIEMPTIHYRPRGFDFISCEVGEFGNFAFVEYEYQDMLTTLYVQRKDDVQDSLYFDFHGEKAKELCLDKTQIPMEVYEIEGEDNRQSSFIAQWNRNDVFYLFSGKMPRQEFVKIVENILF